MNYVEKFNDIAAKKKHKQLQDKFNRALIFYFLTIIINLKALSADVFLNGKIIQ
jgi:hypothetical protein